MRWHASWMLQNSEPETFAAVCACKRDKQVMMQVLPKAVCLIKQERTECSDDRCCHWCHSLPAFLVRPSEIWVFRHQITTPVCPPLQAMVAPNQLEHEQDSSCPPLLSDTRPYWPRKHDVQGTFKATSLHETTTWTSCSCDIEIISKRWSEPELGKLLRWPCRDSSGFLNLHGNSTVFSERWLGGLWSIDLLNFAWFIVLVSKNWHKLHKHTFLLLTDSDQSDTDSLANDHFKNIWHDCAWYRGLKVKLPQCGSNFTRSWLPCEVKSSSGWWVRFWRVSIEHGKSLCKTSTYWFFLLKVNSYAGKLRLFMLLGRCAFLRCCAYWCSNSEAHGPSPSSSRSFKLSRKLTQLAPFFEISTVFWVSDLAACKSIDLLNFAWFIVLVCRNTDFADCHQFHTVWNRMTCRTSEGK